MDLLPAVRINRQQQQHPQQLAATVSAPRLAHRKSSLSAALRTINPIEMNNDSASTMRRNSIAWQTMSQHLTLQLEQHRRASELNSRSDRLKSLDGRRQTHTAIPIDEVHTSEEVPTINDDIKPPFIRPDARESISEFETGSTEDNALLKTDVHIIPMAKLVERFSSNLQQGLTTETVTKHRSEFGMNRLTPPPKPSLLWMFFKQILIGFNGILWVATLFAFLSYVS
jgi:magnesium-transporting ATPase (P-type)